MLADGTCVLVICPRQGRLGVINLANTETSREGRDTVGSLQTERRADDSRHKNRDVCIEQETDHELVYLSMRQRSEMMTRWM